MFRSFMSGSEPGVSAFDAVACAADIDVWSTQGIKVEDKNHCQTNREQDGDYPQATGDSLIRHVVMRYCGSRPRVIRWLRWLVTLVGGWFFHSTVSSYSFLRPFGSRKRRKCASAGAT
jgi:hypothetical protein